MWDAINETVILPRFTAEENAITRLAQSLGRVGMIRLAFEEARSVGSAGASSSTTSTSRRSTST